MEKNYSWRLFTAESLFWKNAHLYTYKAKIKLPVCYFILQQITNFHEVEG